jgi:cation diffusion facilitator CzcD-associated flavoprotein CzcO
VARRYGVLDRIHVNTEVSGLRWDGLRNRWLIKTSGADHEADIVITACGQLSVPKIAPLKGLESFQGPAFHTAEWRHDVDLAGKSVAVIGSGCSAIQVVPAIQPYVESVTIYQRSPAWTIPRLDFAYPAYAQRLFARFPVIQRLDRAAALDFMEVGALALTRRHWLLVPFRAVGRHQIKKAIADPDLRRKVTPVDA